jgi:hypothetical protein
MLLIDAVVCGANYYAESAAAASMRRRNTRLATLHNYGVFPSSLNIAMYLELAPFERRRYSHGEGIQLLGRIGAEIDFRALEACVP